MAIPVSGIANPSLGASTLGEAAGSPSQSDFFETLREAMNQVEDLHAEAQGKVAGMLDGSGDDVHSAMIAVEKAGLAFEMMVQVRNKIVQAYQTISQMQF